MLKYLIQHGYVNLGKLLLELYPALDLNEKEMVILLKLCEMLKNNQATISTANLSKKTSMNVDECSDVLNGLFNRGLVTLNLEYTKQGKSRESFNLDEFFRYLEGYFQKQITDCVVSENENYISEIKLLLEDAFHRILTPIELQMIVEWANRGEAIGKIKKALGIAISNKKLNINYVDACLAHLDDEKEGKGLSEADSKLIYDLCRKMK